MRVPALLAVVAGLFAAPAAAQGPDPAGYVTGLYQRYFGVGPDPAGLAFWLDKLRRGMDPSEVHANVLGSQQFFDQVGRSNPAFIARVFTEVLGRQATPGEVEDQLRKLKRRGDDRVKWGKEFLRDVGGAIPPVPPAGGDLPTRLVTACQLVAQSAQAECPGQQGWLIVNQANNLVAAAAAGRPVLENPAANPAVTAQTIQNIEAGLAGLTSGLAGTGFPAPNTRLHADQAAEIIAAFRQAGGPGLPQPGFPQPGFPQPGLPGGGVLSREDADRLRPLARDLARQARQTGVTLRAVVRPDWQSQQVRVEFDQLAAGVDRTRTDVRAGYPVAELQATLARGRGEFESLNRRIDAGINDARVRQSWYATAAAFDRLAQAAGVPPGGVGPGLPGGGGVPPQAVAAVDSAIANADATAAAFTPYQFAHPAVGRLQAELGAVRNTLARLRQTLGQNPPRQQVQAEFAAVSGQYQAVQRLHTQAVTGGRIPNAPSLAGLGTALAGLNAALGQ